MSMPVRSRQTFSHMLLFISCGGLVIFCSRLASGFLPVNPSHHLFVESNHPVDSASSATSLVPFTQLSESSDGVSIAEGDGGKVSVRIEKDLPHVSSVSEARDAWIEHHWKKGGGLPIVSIQKKNDNDEEDILLLRRVVVPIMMEETLYLPTEENEDQDGSDITDLHLEYKVTSPGPALASDLIPDTHAGRVTFTSNNQGEGCRMIWKVEFNVARLQTLYQRVTEFTIGTAARTVAEALEVPRVLSLNATLDGIADPIEARREWLEFVWARGGGLPILPPIPVGQVLPEGGGSARRTILRIPPLLTESVVSTSSSSSTTGGPSSVAELVYQLDKPGWTTVPFLVHTHLGRVTFARSSTRRDDSVDLRWEVEIRPFPLLAPLIEKMVEMVVSTLIRNLVVHFAEPGSRVDIKPPRGNTELSGGIENFGSVDKDTWLGGVLYSHLGDTRSAVEQTVSLVQPWTWGRSGCGDETDGSVTYKWSAVKVARSR